MERLTRPTVKVDESAARYMVDTGGIAVNLYCMNDRFLELILNGPTINGVKKDILRQMIRALYDTLQRYEDTGLEPEQAAALKAYTERKAVMMVTEIDGMPIDRVRELAQAEQEGRLVVLPCKVGDYVYIPSIERQEAIRVRVQGISVSVSGRTILRFGGYPAESAWGDGCGKDWFLTREEAEKALRGGTHGD